MTDELRVGEYEGWMLTANGMRVDFSDPEPSQITIVDIAQHLGNICRFTGATKRFYSVAQHSCFVARIVEDTLANELTADAMETTVFYDQLLAAMLHDAAEAYINDLSSPLKNVIGGRYRWIENGLIKVIFERYGVDVDYKNNLVKDADNIALMHERFYLLPHHKDWEVDKDQIRYAEPPYIPPQAAGKMFYEAFKEMLVKRNALRAEERVSGDGR